MADQPADVDPDLAFQRIQVVSKGVPAPGYSLLQNSPGNGFHAHEAFDKRILVFVLHRCQGEPAIAHDHGSDAMLRLGGAIRIPEDLSVQVGVMIDEAG